MALTGRDQESADLLLHAYLDGELDIASAIAIERSIEAEPALANQAADIRVLQAALRNKFPRESIPPHVQSKVDALVRKEGISRWRPTWTSMAASLVVAIVLSSTSTWLAMRTPTSSAITNELVDGHLRSLVAQQPTDVSSSDRHTVKPWFNGKVAQSPRVKDLSAAGYALAGGRVDVLEKVAVPTLVYNRRKHLISVTAVPEVGSTPTSISVNGFNIVSWNDEAISYWAISDLNLAELNEFITLYRQPP
jgi:anti-sigma factor RsiW